MRLKLRRIIKNTYTSTKDIHISTEDPTRNVDSSEFEVDNWALSDFVVEKLVPIVGVRPFPLSELLLMASTVCRFKPTHIFEWGTHLGKSARIFHETSAHFGINAKIYSIDLPDDVSHNEHPQEQRGIYVKGISGVSLIQGDGLNDTLKLLKKLPKKSRPLFFIDGDHSYKSVKRELTGLLKARPDGVFLLHDTFYQSEDSGYNIDSHKVIQEVIGRRKGYKVISTNTGLPGMSLVYKS